MIDFHTAWTVPALAVAIYGAAVGVDKLSPDGPTRVALKSLVYEDGMFVQEHHISGAGVIQMDWSAEINRGAVQLCSGGGRAPYQSETPKSFSADDWTGGECPNLQDGDEGVAVWEYFDSNGTRVRITGTVVISDIGGDA
jgi:hypothetical protein